MLVRAGSFGGGLSLGGAGWRAFPAFDVAAHFLQDPWRMDSGVSRARPPNARYGLSRQRLLFLCMPQAVTRVTGEGVSAASRRVSMMSPAAALFPSRRWATI